MILLPKRGDHDKLYRILYEEVNKRLYCLYDVGYQLHNCILLFAVFVIHIPYVTGIYTCAVHYNLFFL